MLKRMIEYLEMKWLMDGWKYIVGLVVLVLGGYLAYPYIVLWAANKHYDIFSWDIFLLGIILGATVVSVCVMFYNAAVVEPRAGKTNFNRNK